MEYTDEYRIRLKELTFLYGKLRFVLVDILGIIAISRLHCHAVWSMLLLTINLGRHGLYCRGMDSFFVC